VNKYLHTVASVGFLFTLNYDAWNHDLKKKKLHHMSTICSPFSFWLIAPNFSPVRIAFHLFFTWIALSEVALSLL